MIKRIFTNNLSYIFLFLFNVSLIFIIFQKSRTVFFFQDDFFLFSISRFKSLNDLLAAFIPRTDAIYYRPLSLQFFYAGFYELFKLNVFYYHIFQILIHAVNSLLVFILIKKLFMDRRLAFFTALFFAVSWTHFYELTWIASTFNSIGLFFILIYLLSFLNEITKRLFLAEFFLTASLLSIEIAVICPVLLIIILAYAKQLSKKNFIRIIFHFIIVLCYLILRFIIFKIPAVNSYQLGASPQSFKNIVIFILWLFNFPEASIVHLHLPRLSLLTVLDPWFTQTFPLFSIFLTISVIFWVVFFMQGIILKNKTLKPVFFFGVLWFIVSIMPVIVIPKRAYPYYPVLAQIGLWLVLSHFILHSRLRIFGLAAFLVFIVGNILAIRFNNDNHWIFASSYASKNSYEKYLTISPVIKNHSLVFWPIDDKTTRNALVNGLGFNVFANNYDQKFYLRQEDIPQEKKSQVFNVF